MKKSTYKIVDLPGLSGLHCVGDYQDDINLVEVSELVNVGLMIGDRLLRYPLPPGALFINPHFLEETDDVSSREFADDNPYGLYEYEGSFQQSGLKFVYCVFENAVTVSVLENEKTIYTNNFFSQKESVMKLLLGLAAAEVDPEDVIFELKKLQER